MSKMRYVLALCVVTIAALAAFPFIGRSSPTEGHSYQRIVIGNPPAVEKKTYKGGERASVIVWSQDSTPARLSVYDSAGKLVGRDVGQVGLTVIWYPPRDGEYKIVTESLTNKEGRGYVAYK